MFAGLQRQFRAQGSLLGPSFSVQSAFLSAPGVRFGIRDVDDREPAYSKPLVKKIVFQLSSYF